MLLELIISHYMESPSCITRMLDSIKLQQCIDFNDIHVKIVNDGNDMVLKDKQLNLKSYPFKTDYVIKEGGGIASVREYGLQNCKADYIMFCDGDDLFLRTNALGDILDKLKKEKPDILTSKFVTDMQDDKGNTEYFQDYYQDNVGIHGKVFSMDFLTKNNIHGDTSLQLYEDSFFIRICFALNPKKIDIETPTYFGKYREGSFTRSNDNFIIRTYKEKLQSNEAIVKDFLKRNMIINAATYVFVASYECYFELMLPEGQLESNAQYKEDVELYILNYWDRYEQLLKVLPYDYACSLMEVLRDRYYKQKNRLSVEDYTFPQGQHMLRNKYEQVNE